MHWMLSSGHGSVYVGVGVDTGGVVTGGCVVGGAVVGGAVVGGGVGLVQSTVIFRSPPPLKTPSFPNFTVTSTVLPSVNEPDADVTLSEVASTSLSVTLVEPEYTISVESGWTEQSFVT